MKKMWSWFEEHMSQVIVVFCFAIVLIFSIVVMILASQGVEVSSTLIEYFYKFFGFELLALSGIKISKHIGSAFGRAEQAIDGGIDFSEEYGNQDEEVQADEE